MSDSSKVTIPHNFTPRPYQFALFEALDAGCKRAFLRWSRRSGKDKTCFNYMIKEAFRVVGMYYYFFPSYQQGRKALWEGIQKGERLLDHIPPGLAKFNNNELKISLINGSIIRVVGTDNIDSIVGTNPIGMVFSEFSLQDPTAWDYMKPILRENGGWAIFNGTPRGKNHMYDLESHVKGLKDWYVSEVQSLWPDLPNYYPVVKPTDIQKDRDEGLDEATIEQEYGVSYVAGIKGAYYSDQIVKAREQNRIALFPYNDHKYVDTFWDLGWTDDTAVWFQQTDGGAKIFIDYYENNNKDLKHYIQMLVDKGYSFRTHYLPHDAAGGKLQFGLSHKDFFRQLCAQANISDDVVVVPKPSTKQFAIDAVRSRFSRYYFDEKNCSDGLLKLSLYHRKYDPKRQVFLESPTHDWTSHAADALTTEALSSDLQFDEYNRQLTVEPITNFNPLDDTN